MGFVVRCLLVWVALWPASADAASVAGTISGDPSWSRPRETNVLVDRHVCGINGRVRLPDPGVDADGHLEGVVVWVEGAKESRKRRALPNSTKPLVIDQVDCVFVPSAAVVAVGTQIRVRNSDAVFHNVHSYFVSATETSTTQPQTRKTWRNISMPIGRQEASLGVARRAGRIELECDAGHGWMRSHIRVLDHPFFAQTDAKGRFRISGLPPGRYNLIAWHPSLGTHTQPLGVASKDESRVVHIAFGARLDVAPSLLGGAVQGH